jgi:sulfur-oxidizing protein SoxY
VRSAHAAVADAIIAFTGGAKPAEGDVPLGIPEIGENDASVPVTVAAPGACMTETATAV